MWMIGLLLCGPGIYISIVVNLGSEVEISITSYKVPLKEHKAVIKDGTSLSKIRNERKVNVNTGDE